MPCCFPRGYPYAFALTVDRFGLHPILTGIAQSACKSLGHVLFAGSCNELRTQQKRVTRGDASVGDFQLKAPLTLTRTTSKIPHVRGPNPGRLCERQVS